MAALKLTPEHARWICNPQLLGFSSTDELTPEPGVLGQDDAVDALQYGLETRIHGNNVFARGLSGFGRMSLIHQMIEETPTGTFDLPDQCYVYNFAAPDQPKLLELKAGSGKSFRRSMDRFSDFAQADLPEYLN
ncbi:MAG: Lon-like protease helical domain-containing protein [bacterium]|nr:hypothetical protein [Gammaproteobacteria bacterium]HIL96136.1 hypothetical protein [Pseudomonadales bacterium]